MGWSRFFRRAQWDKERATELEAHLAHECDDNIARGLSPDDARRAAYLKLGNPTRIREDIYTMNTIPILDTMWHDLRYAARMLRTRPGFTAVGVLSLAIGIGVCSSGFALLSAAMLRPLPGAADPTGLVSLLEPVPYPFFETYRDDSDVAVAAAAFVGPVPFGVTIAGETDRVFGHLVSPE